MALQLPLERLYEDRDITRALSYAQQKLLISFRYCICVIHDSASWLGRDLKRDKVNNPLFDTRLA